MDEFYYLGWALGEELVEAIEWLIGRLGKEIVTEAELSNEFLNRVVLPFLRRRFGFLADAKLERRIRRGRYDARIGSLLFEFERPFRGISDGIRQAKRYVEEFRSKGEMVKCFVTDGRFAVFVDERGEVGEIKGLRDYAHELQKELSLLAPMPAEPEDLLGVLGPSSDVCRAHIRVLLEVFEDYRDIPFVSECFELWRRVYGAAANLTSDVVKAVVRYAKGLGIELKDKSDVEEFLFVVETYLAIFMKLLVAAVAVERRLVEAPRLSELLTPPLEAFERLADRVPFLRRAFEHDAFSWFVDAAKKDKSVAMRIGDIIGGMALALDLIDLSKVRFDLLRCVYQEFFDPETRKALGEFYTNEDIVKEVLDAVGYKGEKIIGKILLDPACGSGTFLIVAVRRFIEAARKRGLSDVEILEAVTEQINGIDIHPFAVAMARVNFLLAISELIDPNVRRIMGELKIPIYWTDSLATFTRRPEPTGVPIVEVDVSPLGRFSLPEPEVISWGLLFDVARRAIDEGWSVDRYLQEFPEDVAEKYKHTLTSFLKDFRKKAEEGKDSRWISTLRNVVVVDMLRGRCDFVVGNPPWVRLKNVEEELRERVGRRFKFYRKDANWNPGLKKTVVPFRGQVDYSLAFVESALKFLDDGGIFGFVITSNVVRSLYAGKMRKNLLENTTVLYIADYSLSRRQLFEGAQNAPLILVFKKEKAEKEHEVKVKMENRLKSLENWRVKQEELPLVKNDWVSPWLIAPPRVISAIRKMGKAGPRLGDVFCIYMGIKTAANDYFFVKEFEPTDEPDVVLVLTEGGERARIEKELLRPLIRGKDVDAWSYKVEDYIIWTHDDLDGKVLSELPRNAKIYFENIKNVLNRRRAVSVTRLLKRGAPIWVIGDVSAEKLKNKVAWQDIEKTIKAVYLPSEINTDALGKRKLIVDHTLYFVSVDDKEVAYALAALLNSTAARSYIASYVMRTGAAYCHHLGWYMGVIPIPKALLTKPPKRLVEISRKLHEVKGQDEELLNELDEVVAELYGLTKEELKTMQEFLEFFTAG